MKKLAAILFILFVLWVMPVVVTSQGVVRVQSPPVAGATPTPNPLNTGLVGCWNLGEASGNALDSSGNSLTLTDHASIGQAAGIGGVGNSRTFNGSTQYFSHADTANLQFGDHDWTYVIWTYRTADATEVITGKTDGGANQEMILAYSGSDFVFYAYVFDSGGTPVLVEDTAGGNPSANTWYMVLLQYDATADTIGISRNAGTITTASVGPLHTPGTAAFEIGSFNGGSAPWPGRLQYAAKWDVKLSGTLVADLYNGGAGRPCTY